HGDFDGSVRGSRALHPEQSGPAKSALFARSDRLHDHGSALSQGGDRFSDRLAGEHHGLVRSGRRRSDPARQLARDVGGFRWLPHLSGRRGDYGQSLCGGFETYATRSLALPANHHPDTVSVSNSRGVAARKRAMRPTQETTCSCPQRRNYESVFPSEGDRASQLHGMKKAAVRFGVAPYRRVAISYEALADNLHARGTSTTTRVRWAILQGQPSE